MAAGSLSFPPPTRDAFTSSRAGSHRRASPARPPDHRGPRERASALLLRRPRSVSLARWSPDGQELIFMSNRGHIWGSGGLWRMPARTRGRRARDPRTRRPPGRPGPDWSRDGKRVVYSSYLGRQWHQLWLMTAEGGDPFQLTYGEFDATAPRWSPDGRRIAYITNERAEYGLSLVDVPGGRRSGWRIDRRKYLQPVGRLQLGRDRRAGRPTPARVSITGPDGRSYRS